MHKLVQNHQTSLRTCNCRSKTMCPLSGNCLTSIVYEAKVSSSDKNETKKYIGLASTTFKERFYNHNMSFNNEQHESNTHLSKYIWNLKRENINYNITWSKLLNARTYHPTRKKCDLCLAEKVLILTTENILNSRTELFQKCRHKNKYLLCNI